jgi:uncharacterized membrane protein
VLALDQIHRLLRVAGRLRLHSCVMRDGLGQPRVICRTPDWNDFVRVACTEIRACGAGQVQVARRLRALLDNLIMLLPEFRHAELIAERERLDLAVRAAYSIPADLALASLPDVQGLGGAAGPRVLN